MNDFTKKELELILITVDNHAVYNQLPLWFDLSSKIKGLIASHCDHKPIFELDTGTGVYNFYCLKCDKDLIA